VQYIWLVVDGQRMTNLSWPPVTPHPATFKHGKATIAAVHLIMQPAFQIHAAFAIQSTFCSPFKSTM
jgi:hypothetical protein